MNIEDLLHKIEHLYYGGVPPNEIARKLKIGSNEVSDYIEIIEMNWATESFVYKDNSFKQVMNERILNRLYRLALDAYEQSKKRKIVKKISTYPDDSQSFEEVISKVPEGNQSFLNLALRLHHLRQQHIESIHFSPDAEVAPVDQINTPNKLLGGN